MNTREAHKLARELAARCPGFAFKAEADEAEGGAPAIMFQPEGRRTWAYLAHAEDIVQDEKGRYRVAHAPDRMVMLTQGRAS